MDNKAAEVLRYESRAMNDLEHPNVIRLYQVIEALSKIYLVMEYAAGGTLAEVLKMKGRLENQDAQANINDPSHHPLHVVYCYGLHNRFAAIPIFSIIMLVQ